jgi:hypothetical protein
MDHSTGMTTTAGSQLLKTIYTSRNLSDIKLPKSRLSQPSKSIQEEKPPKQLKLA